MRYKQKYLMKLKSFKKNKNSYSEMPFDQVVVTLKGKVFTTRLRPLTLCRLADLWLVYGGFKVRHGVLMY